MARPKQNQGGPTAQERIEEAFWAMLSEGSYETITITALARQAEVNHNTIYYYFDGIDDLALQLFRKNIPENICDLFRALLLEGPEEITRLISQDNILTRWRRFCLFARGDSPFLFQIFRDMITGNWYEILRITPGDLTQEEETELEFILSGLIAVMGRAFRMNDPKVVLGLLDRPIGQGVLSSLRALYRGSNPET